MPSNTASLQCHILSYIEGTYTTQNHGLNTTKCKTLADRTFLCRVNERLNFVQLRLHLVLSLMKFGFLGDELGLKLLHFGAKFGEQ